MNVFSIFGELFKAIGLVAGVGGGIAAISYAIFKRFGEKWLDAKFEERLAEYRHAQQKELERLRFQINALLDRATKLHQREFDVLPEAWAKLNDAFWQVSNLVSPGQSYPDLSQMSDAHFREFVAHCDLMEWEKNELLASADRQSYYVDHIYWHRLNSAKTYAKDSHVFLTKNGIFLPSEIKEQFVEVDTLVWDAVDEDEHNERNKIIPRGQTKQQSLLKNGPNTLKALEAKVQERLRNAEHLIV
jgi:hypothetical protein